LCLQVTSLLANQGPDSVDAVTLCFVVLLLTVAPLWMQYAFVRYQPVSPHAGSP